MGCFSGIARMALMIINGIFLILGIILLSVGIWVTVDKTYLVQLLANFDTGSTNVGGLLSSAAYILIAFGAFVFILGFCGFCGAYKEVKCLLTLYAILVIVVMVVEVIVVIMCLVYYEKVMSQSKTYLTTTVNTKYDGQWNTPSVISLALDSTMIYLQCCGINNSTDFATATAWTNKTYVDLNGALHNATIPVTCCKYKDVTYFPAGSQSAGLTDATCPYDPTPTNSNMNTGCYSAIVSYVTNYSLTVIIIVSVIVGVELLGLLFACILRREDVGGQSG